MRIGDIIEEETSGGYNSQYVSSGKRMGQGNYGQTYNNTNNKSKSNGFTKTQHSQMLQ